MRHVPVRLIGTFLCVPLLVGATSVQAEDRSGRLAGALKVEQSVRANLLPIDPAYVTPKCLIPYPICKLVYASVALIASWEQILSGGDLKGAANTIGRGFSGPWIAQPKHVTGEPLWTLPPPAPFVAYMATGRTNMGPVPLDPFPVSELLAEEGGDVLPPDDVLPP